ncbi:hypothetical protein [Aureispira anguillae]|uniref:Uncharacterized protein n=1 Tax=Aureispira anguillae TaxID=2864201 RepID=A0A916DSU2_9BACT|nr:hypothetical protein [Aureispira anguillae]BDS11036.1 hypothetical protein AsAng_0017470 [Aureispira anguillae]
MQALEQQYGNALKHKKFAELIQLQKEIVERHGNKGILYLLQQQLSGQICFLTAINDKTCPWFVHKDLPLEVFIDTIWAPVQNQLPLFLTLLKERCQHILVVKQDTEWQLVYFVELLLEDQTPFFAFYNGAAPLSDEAAKERPNITAQYQQHLGLFYQVHNGFGELNRESVLPLDELTKIKCEGVLYLRFFDFVSPARQCIKMEDLAQKNPISYDYDRGNIRSYYPFWNFLDERLALMDEE